MKQGIPSRRTRGRGNNTRGRQQSNIRNQQMDSNGPAGRLRGTPQQILDRYSALARDASSAGDTVLAENLWQHAEHYTRMLSAAQQQQQPNQQPNQQQQGGNGQRYGNGNGRDDQYDYDDQDDDSSGSHDSGNGSDDRGNYDRGNYDRNNDSRNNDDRGSGQQRRDTPIEPLVLKSDPEPVPAAEAQSAEAQAKADPAESEQPEAPAVWTKEDAQKATEEAAGEERPAPRRRRRTRFPRQADGSEGGSASESSGKNEDGKTRTDKGKSASNGEGKDTDSQSRDDQSGGEGQVASPTQLTLPEDPSPAALVELLTREEESKPRRKRAAGDDSDS